MVEYVTMTLRLPLRPLRLLSLLGSTCRLGLSADLLQMPESGIWGNPLVFVEEAMQVHILLAPCRHPEKRFSEPSQTYVLKKVTAN